MSKTLIIAEKPSVARDLQETLGKKQNWSKFGGSFKGNRDFFENDKYIISSAIGHLVEQKLPTLPNGKSLPWKFEVLPVIPDSFELQPINGTKTRFNLLKKLMKRRDVELIVNACDAGREGELIFRYIMQFAECKKASKRLWLQSMTPKSIMQAMDDLRDENEMNQLAAAAYCRSESDWLVGINSTRAMTAFNSKYGGFNKTPVGRVQTPTLAMLVERELEIRNFKPRAYFEIKADFEIKSGEYSGMWFDEKFNKKKANDAHARAERLWQKDEAEKIAKRCRGKKARLEETSKINNQSAPLLYDLTSLQRDCSSRFGLSARRTLQIAQSLYEKHKAITYPRTDSKHLPQDYLEQIRRTTAKMAKSSAPPLKNLAAHANKISQNNWVKKNPRYFNDSKISDHFAIVPTEQLPTKLDDYEKRVYNAICQRLLAAFFPQAKWNFCERISIIENEKDGQKLEDKFKTKGKVLLEAGWLEVYGNKSADKDAKMPNLPPLAKDEYADTIQVEVNEKETKAPPRYNEATLLSAMETAGRRVAEEELRQAMSERGLGTPATRAAIIEGLIHDKYVERMGRDFVVNNRGLRLIEQLRSMNIDILTSPELTGEWEYKLKKMENGSYQRNSFMAEISDLTREVVKTAKNYAGEILNKEYPPFDCPCPQCGAKQLQQDEGMYKCIECNFKLPKVIASRPLSEEEAKQLLSSGSLPKIEGFLSRFRQPFNASLELVDKKGKLKLEFIFEKSEQEIAELKACEDEANYLCECPACEQGKIYITPTSYICSNRAQNGTTACKARLAREMCKYQIPVEEAEKFFAKGRTSLISNFISKKGRPFAATLVLDTKGRRIMKWEFQPRAKKAAKAAKAK